ncbi:DUF2956 domain-containing protein [Paraglaciecola hydrolytica]|uniref:DUF2956 domain-containing protein n=1 Tax=Paraglaciecola hydrolytica TaxID=1799789 RepID=A0A135ZYN1_9ALTE|nr:DUF2956 domain-containing protein [Paraglaciecola hydrolytica]KXI28093.1 hypothetical protein AX660_17045 [Paraglaciecola hydrolytica]
MKHKVSPEVEAQALKIAKGRQKEGQTKEQTKLIALGIQKGVAEYKKQHNIKLRAIDKQRKQTLKQRQNDNSEVVEEELADTPINYLPWILLALSWIGFIAYIAW